MPKEPAAVTSAKVARTSAIIVAIIALVGILVTAYLEFVQTSDNLGQQTETEYTGRVIDAPTLQPIAGAKITLTFEGVSPIVYSDDEGFYRFKVEIDSEISGQVRVDAAGYPVYMRNITISPNSTVIEDIRLTP